MSIVHHVCDRVIHWGLVALIVFTPFAFGTVEPWSIALTEWGIITLLLFFSLSRLWPERGPLVAKATRKTDTLLIVPVGLFVLLCVLQTVPLPMRWLRVVSPGTARMYESVDFGTWESVEGKATEARQSRQDPLLQLQPIERRPVSVNPALTRERTLLLATLVGLFFLVSRWADDKRAVSLVRSVTVVAFLVSVFGLVQLLTWNGKIYWVRKVPSVSASAPNAFGPFVNHDHFAGYVEMAIPTALSFAFWLMDRRRRAGAIAGLRERDSGRDTPFGDGPGDDSRRLSKGILTFFVAVILIVALFFSLSRGGILSSFLSGSVLVALLCRRASSRLLRWSVALVLPVVVVLLIAWIGAETVKKQIGTYGNFSGEASFQLRAIVWSRVVREWPAYAWAGSGLGTFEDSFAPLTPAGSEKRWDKAHNDYLQLLWETGLVGGLLFLCGASLFAVRYWWPALRSFRQPLDPFRVGIAVALMSIALHSLVDFCLQIGANGFLCALLAGLLVALHGRRDDVTLGGRRAQTVEGPWSE